MKTLILQLIAVAYLANQSAHAIPLQTTLAEHQHHHQLAEKIRRAEKKKNEVDPAMIGMIGGLLGGVTNIVGASVGGDTGASIMKAGNMVSGVSAAAATGDAGKIVTSVTDGAS